MKTPKSKRSLVLPRRAVIALVAHRKRQAAERLAAGAAWHDNNLVFCHEDGRMYTSDALNWRFGKITRRAGLVAGTPTRAGHRRVDHEQQRRAAAGDQRHRGPQSTHVTETVYRHVIVPAIRGGASVMNTVFGDDAERGNGAADTAATP